MPARAVQRLRSTGFAPWGWRLAVAGLVGWVVVVAWRGVTQEMQSSRVQARWLADLAAQLLVSAQPGRSESIRFPADGPYDLRLGYHGLPSMIERLSARGFEVRAQARWSPKLIELHDRGLFTIYPEKSQAGLRVDDDPAPLRYSFTLFESDGQVSRLRVQTDNFDQPFDLNEGVRLDMGSTAKLRTLVSYLEVVAQLHGRWAGLDTATLAAQRPAAGDALAR